MENRIQQQRQANLYFCGNRQWQGEAEKESRLEKTSLMGEGHYQCEEVGQQYR